MTWPEVHFCETCDTANAGWGFDVPYRDPKSGDVESVRLWFCYDHKADGVALATRAREEFQPKARPRPAPEPDAQGALNL